MRHRVLQDPRADRVPLAVIGVEQAFGGLALDVQGELPAEVDRVLDARAHALGADRQMDVGGVPARKTRPRRYSAACRLTSVNLEIHVGSWTPKSVPYTAVSASRRSASVGSVAGPSCCSVTTSPHGPPVLHHAHRVDADVVDAGCPWAVSSVTSHLGDQVAAGRLRTRRSRCRPPCGSTLRPPSAADQVRRTQRLARRPAGRRRRRRPGRSP